MSYNLLGKKVRGPFAFPSGVISTNSDTMAWMLRQVPQIGAVIGKSTTIEPRLGNREDIYIQSTPNSGWNAVGFSNPGLQAAIEEFTLLTQAFPKGVFLMPQIGEDEPMAFAHCIQEFEKHDIAHGYEVNVSCGHAAAGGINLSQPEMINRIFSAMRAHTQKPLVAKLNAGSPDLEDLAKAAIAGGATALSLINTLMGPHPEIKNKFGGYSGPPIFPVLVHTLKRVKAITNVPIIAMGGIAGAGDIRILRAIDPNLFYEIGTSLAEMTSLQIKEYFEQLALDLEAGSDNALALTKQKYAHQYRPFIIKEIVSLTSDLKIFKFYENIDAGIGQFVILKVGDSRNNETKCDDEYAKPYSVGADSGGLELVIRRVGKATSKVFELNANNVVRIKGPYGNKFEFPQGKKVVFVGAGCGIAPVHHAASHFKGDKVFIIGVKTKNELVYKKEFEAMGECHFSTDDGSFGFKGYLPELLTDYLKGAGIKNMCFYNCGPEVAMSKNDAIERQYTKPEYIFHVVERMTCCGVGICGKCSIPGGERSCVDGPVFNGVQFTPGLYSRDKTGKKILINLR